MLHDITRSPIRVGVHDRGRVIVPESESASAQQHAHASVPGQPSRILEYVVTAIATEGESAREGAYVRVQPS